jgi:hypothetical protein
MMVKNKIVPRGNFNHATWLFLGLGFILLLAVGSALFLVSEERGAIAGQATYAVSGEEISSGCKENWNYLYYKNSKDPNSYVISKNINYCTKENDNYYWCASNTVDLKNAYIGGQRFGTAYKYCSPKAKEGDVESSCSENWEYYDWNNNKVYKNLKGCTFTNDQKAWCGVKESLLTLNNVYMTGSAFGTKWKYCTDSKGQKVSEAAETKKEEAKPTCKDSDPSNDPFVKGSVTYFNKKFQKEKVQEDICQDGKLIQFTCENDDWAALPAEECDCVNNGVCIKDQIEIVNPIIRGNLLEYTFKPDLEINAIYLIKDKEKYGSFSFLDPYYKIPFKSIDGSYVENSFSTSYINLFDIYPDGEYELHFYTNNYENIEIKKIILDRSKYSPLAQYSEITPRESYISTNTKTNLIVFPRVNSLIEEKIQSVSLEIVNFYSEKNQFLKLKNVVPDFKTSAFFQIPYNKVTSLSLKFLYKGTYHLKMIYTFVLTDGTVLKWVEHTNLRVLDGKEFPTPSLKSFSNLNNLNDPNRFNLIFVMIGEKWNSLTSFEREEQLKKIISTSLDGNVGLYNVEPYKSNKEKFNILYSDNVFLINEKTPNYLGSYLTDETIELSSGYQKFRLGIDLPNTKFIIIERDNSFFPASGNLCDKTDSILLYNFPESFELCLNNGYTIDKCYTILGIDRFILHELGHYLAWLGEEYETDNLFDETDYIKLWGFNLNDGLVGDIAYYSPYFTSDFCSKNEWNTYICNPSDKVVKECIQNAGWKDLIGNGCGKDGVIDCDKSDPNYPLEVTCQYSNAGWPKSILSANLIKPTKVSLMDERNKLYDKYIFIPGKALIFYDTSIPNKDRLYGQVNERQICRYIKGITGSVGGICNQLCLDGCPDNQRCIQGTCQEVKETPGNIAGQAYTSKENFWQDATYTPVERSPPIEKGAPLSLILKFATEEGKVPIQTKITIKNIYNESEVQELIISERETTVSLYESQEYEISIESEGYFTERLSFGGEEDSMEIMRMDDIVEAYVTLKPSIIN